MNIQNTSGIKSSSLDCQFVSGKVFFDCEECRSNSLFIISKLRNCNCLIVKPSKIYYFNQYQKSSPSSHLSVLSRNRTTRSYILRTTVTSWILITTRQSHLCLLYATVSWVRPIRSNAINQDWSEAISAQRRRGVDNLTKPSDGKSKQRFGAIANGCGNWTTEKERYEARSSRCNRKWPLEESSQNSVRKDFQKYYEKSRRI